VQVESSVLSEDYFHDKICRSFCSMLEISMNQEKSAAMRGFEKLYSIITRLREPDGCPWDLDQTPLSMRKNLIEEAYEIVNAIDALDDTNLEEEIGDLLLVVLMIVRMKEQENRFGLEGVFAQINEKLIRRHPHVFGEAIARDADDVVTQWDRIKKEVEGKHREGGALSGIPASLPPLERAYEIQKKVSKVGFDWEKPGPIFEKLEEELAEFRQAVEEGNVREMEIELGDIFFTVVNIGRILKIDPSLALNRTNEKFTARFSEMEKRIALTGKTLTEVGLDRMDSVWNDIKQEMSDEDC
jgi:tetrapyrrole methylase family protein/MazG family protein